MEFSFLSSLMEILKETFRNFFRNGKLIPSITLLSIFLNSILFLSYLFSTKQLVTDFSTKLQTILLDEATSLSSHPQAAMANNSYYLHIFSLAREELRFFVLEYLIFVTVISFTSFFVAISTILVSAENFVAKRLRLKELASMVVKSWRRALITISYTTLLGLGYVFFVFALIILPLELIFFNPLAGKISTVSIIVLVLAVILYLRLCVVWILALVVSVLEDKCGFEAFARASELGKALKLLGFLLNLLFGGLSYAVFRVLSVTFSDNKVPFAAMSGANIGTLVLLIAFSSLIKAFSFISYVVLYFEGKKIHGEELVEMRGYTLEYSKVATSAPIVSSNIP